MRLRFRSATYKFGGSTQSLERHFRELRGELLRQGQHYGLLQPATQWRPPVDTHETPDALLVKVELAGMREDEIEVTLYENAVVISGKREDDVEHDDTLCYHEAQVRYGPFRAEVLLPVPVRQDAVEAVYENGFLRVKLPKVTQSDPRSGQRSQMTSHGRSQSESPMDAAPVDLTSVVPTTSAAPKTLL